MKNFSIKINDLKADSTNDVITVTYKDETVHLNDLKFKWMEEIEQKRPLIQRVIKVVESLEGVFGYDIEWEMPEIGLTYKDSAFNWDSFENIPYKKDFLELMRDAFNKNEHSHDEDLADLSKIEDAIKHFQQL